MAEWPHIEKVGGCLCGRRVIVPRPLPSIRSSSGRTDDCEEKPFLSLPPSINWGRIAALLCSDRQLTMANRCVASRERGLGPGLFSWVGLPIPRPEAFAWCNITHRGPSKEVSKLKTTNGTPEVWRAWSGAGGVMWGLPTRS